MKLHILILITFGILTLIMTYPLALHMHEAVQEPGDSLFSTWTIAWDIKALLKNPLNIFHANIFYPYKYTLAYSEHMIGVGLLALPVYLFTKNPLFIYNSMLLLSFILCGWGAYLLGYYITKDRLAGIVSGLIFAFCPFRFSQFKLGHLHVLISQWMPFTLLFLHKISETTNSRRKFYLGLAFGFFFFLQFISSIHNGLYLGISIVLFLIYYIDRVGISTWIVMCISGVLILPFYYPHLYLAKEFGFIRPSDVFKLYSPQLSSYLAAPGGNWLYGRFLDRFCRPEAVMFSGVMALILAFWKKKSGHIKKRKEFIHPLAKRVINIFIVFNLFIIILIGFTGGIDLGISILGVKLKVTEFVRPINILIILVFLRAILNMDSIRSGVRDFVRRVISSRGTIQFYWILAITAFILSFGPEIRIGDKEVMWGPYSLLYNFIPGFKGIRVSGRIYVLFILSIAVLAGYGVKSLRKRLRKVYYMTYLIPIIILAEYINISFDFKCWIGTNPSLAYKWLQNQQEGFVIIELPMPDWDSLFFHEVEYLYWSIYHGGKLVNGYSGYSPPAYWPIAENMKNFPNEETIEMLKYLGVKYAVVHEGEISNWNWPSVVEKMDYYKDIFSLRFKDGEDYIYELIDRKFIVEPKIISKFINKDNWCITTNYNFGDIHKAIDNDLLTRWHSGAQQKPGMCIELDLMNVQLISEISMYFGEALRDFPRGIELEISKNKRQWDKIPLKFIYANYVKHLIKYPKDNRMLLSFEPEEARYIRLIQTGSHDVFFWSIYELDVY